MLPRLRIIQVGDVHLPSAHEAKRTLDEKDRRFPVDVRNVISSSPTKSVFEHLYRYLTSGAADAVLFMGDLTDVGDISGYRSCANYIANALCLGSKRTFASTPVGIIPGNHDVNRDLAKQSGQNRKFTPLAQALAEVGLPTLPIARPIWLDLKKANTRARIALLNSCWGCGAKEFIPEEFRDDVATAIDKAIQRGSTEKATRAYYDRQFDTPAFSTEAMQAFAQEAIKVPGSEVLLVCAHHNLLPQRLPRLAPYTELINSGAVRGTLSELDRPVLYLHGHIHEDPIEIITVPSRDPIVCISAPAATAGFNILEIVFTHAGLPLSCHVQKWRFDESGLFRMLDRVVVPLLGKRRRSHDRTLQQIYVKLLDARELYWSEVVHHAASVFTGNVEEQLEEALEALGADGHVTIDNYSLSPQSWIVGAKL